VSSLSLGPRWLVAGRQVSLPLSISDSGNFLNTYYSVIMVDTAFQIGFCTFVLSNYMKALPQEFTEAALVDGAGVWKQYYSIVMPLCRPALAALATLDVIFIYNEFFWPLLFIQSGSRLPITTGIKNLQGQFFSDYNLIAAGATFTIIPTLIIYILLQRHFVAGLILGASKGLSAERRPGSPATSAHRALRAKVQQLASPERKPTSALPHGRTTIRTRQQQTNYFDLK
jgi:ABC-type spermidine/putrescine transport system permease subunit II